MTAFDNSDCSSHPGTNLLLHVFICPVADNDFPVHMKAAENVSEFPVTVCGLILVHEIHVDGVIRNLPVELCMQMEQWFSEFLQSQYPGFCR